MNKYNHKEAYCIMKYKCEECGHIEYIWNSRDGVTPFIIKCTKCGKEVKHVEWQNDICIPDLNPSGIRWFIDLTKENYVKQLEKIYEKNTLYYGKTGDEVIKLLLDDWEDNNSPDIKAANIIEIPNDLLRSFYSICKRKGKDTNWEGITKQIELLLKS